MLGVVKQTGQNLRLGRTTAGSSSRLSLPTSPFRRANWTPIRTLSKTPAG